MRTKILIACLAAGFLGLVNQGGPPVTAPSPVSTLRLSSLNIRRVKLIDPRPFPSKPFPA